MPTNDNDLTLLKEFVPSSVSLIAPRGRTAYRREYVTTQDFNDVVDLLGRIINLSDLEKRLFSPAREFFGAEDEPYGDLTYDASLFRIMGIVTPAYEEYVFYETYGYGRTDLIPKCDCCGAELNVLNTSRWMTLCSKCEQPSVDERYGGTESMEL